MSKIVFGFCVAVCLVPTSAAQDAPVSGATTPPAAKASPKERLRVALVDADGHRRTRQADALDAIVGKDGLGKDAFLALRRKISEASPAPESRPATESRAAQTPPPEHSEAVLKLMNTVVLGDGEAADAALAALKAAEGGQAGLLQLNDRSKSLLSRLVSSTLLAAMKTHAIFAGQYDELRNYGPEVPGMLLTWAIEPPREVRAEVGETFKSAAVRALRDVVPAEKATDAHRRGVVAALQKAKSETLALALICALKQFGEERPFNQTKENIEKLAKSEKPGEKSAGLAQLADLHYNARDYANAAKAYEEHIALAEAEKAPASTLYNLYYNCCCTHALSKNSDAAFAMLEKAFKSGAESDQIKTALRSLVEHDMDIKSLRGDPRFNALVEKHLGGAPAKQ